MRETYYSESSRDTAYQDILDKLSGQRRTVFEIILRFGPISDHGIAEKTGIPVHTVVARRNELWGKEKQPNGRYEINEERKLVEFAGFDTATRPRQSLWKVAVRTETPTLF